MEQTRSDLPRAEPPPTLPEHVRRIVREDILSGRFPPGQRLTEALVMQRTGVSRTPVREGMRLLEAEGLVTFERGKGMFVTRGLSREEAVVIYRCRRVIEPYLTRCATERMTPEKLRAIREILDRFAAAVLNQTPESELSRIDAEFHDAIYRTSESDLVNIFHSYWGRRRELSARVYKNESPSLFLREHEEIYEALAAGDGPTAAERMERHIAHGQRVMEELTFVDAAPPSSQAQATLTQ